MEVQDDQDAAFDMDEMKQFLSGRLYVTLTEFHNKLEEDSDTLMASEIILAALSINIGHIVGQLPPKLRKTAIKSIKRIIDEQMVEVAKMSDQQQYGHVGHA